MAKTNPESIRNIVVCGHGSAGKTTLVDSMLVKSGAVKGPLSVDDGTSVCDFDEIEKKHKYSIDSSVVHFEHAGKRFNMIDTPGYPDYIGQAIGAMRAVETAVIVINAHGGIAVNTRRTFSEAGKVGLGRVIVINKMDEENIDFDGLVESIKDTFGSQCVLLNVPIGKGADFKGVVSTLKVPDDTAGALVDPAEISESLMETIIEVDEEVMERYFEGTLPTEQELSSLMVRAISEGNLIPILCTSSKKDIGVAELMDELSKCALPPGAVTITATKGEEEIEVKADADGPLVAQVFKTRIDPFVQKVSYIRVFSGTLMKDSTVGATDARKGIKVSQLFQVQGSENSPYELAGPGDIVAMNKMEDLHTGTSLGEYTLPPIEFPTPMVGLAALPKSRGDESKLSGALKKIVEEDPTFHLDRDAQTKELVMTGMSELHLQIVQERLKARDKVELETKTPKIPYRETIQNSADGSYRHKKQSGGRGQFGEVHIRMFPLPKDADPKEFCTKDKFPSMKEIHHDPKCNFIWVDSIVGGTIPGNFMPAIEKGFKERMARGVIAGYQVENVCVEVHFGKFHAVDSSEQAFKTAASMAFRNVFQEAKPSLLEPVVSLHVTVPGDKVGDVNSDMSTRRGKVLGMDAAGGGMQTVTIEVPLAEVTTYARNLSSMTGGQGSYTMEFSHYDVVPGNVQKDIISAATMTEEEDE